MSPKRGGCLRVCFFKNSAAFLQIHYNKDGFINWYRLPSLHVVMRLKRSLTLPGLKKVLFRLSAL